VKWHSLGYAFRVARPGAPVYPGTRYPTVNGGYRLSGSPVNGYAYYLLGTHVNGGAYYLAGTSVNMAGYAYYSLGTRVKWRVSAMRGTRYQCQMALYPGTRYPTVNGGYRLSGTPGDGQWHRLWILHAGYPCQWHTWPVPVLMAGVGYAYYMAGTHVDGVRHTTLRVAADTRASGTCQ